MQDNPAGAWPAPSDADWRRLVEASLSGRPLSSLAAKIEPGVSIDPLVPASTAPPLWSRAGKAWTRLRRLGRESDAEAISSALATGADGFEIIMTGSAADYGDGLSLAGVRALLADAPLDRCHWRLSTGPDGEACTRIFEEAATAGRLDPQLLSVSFGLDPIGDIASGRENSSDLPRFAGLVARLAARGYAGPFASADARLVHNAGGTPAMELGYALAALLALLRGLIDGGLPDEIAVGTVDVALAADEDQFVTIAKLRAMRLLQARLLAAGGLPRRRLALHAETSWRMLAAEDMQSNLIRTTIAALAAGLGGADSLSVLPFTAAVDDARDRDAERLALTTQAILIEEARLARVDDPAAGSGTIEALTLALAEEGWRRFQAFERDGGIRSAAGAERLRSEIAEAAERRQASLASGTHAIVGVTQFRAETAARPEPPHAGRAADATGLRPRRASAPFESAAS